MSRAVDQDRSATVSPAIPGGGPRREKIDMIDRRAIDRWTNEGGPSR